MATIPLGTTTADGATNYSTVAAGDTVYIASGNRNRLRLTNFHGQAGNPITFIDDGGQCNITCDNDGEASIYIESCSHIRVIGSDVRVGARYARADQHAKIKCITPIGRGLWVKGAGSEDIELGYIEVDSQNNINAQSGVVIRDSTLPVNTIWQTFKLHNIYLHDVYEFEGFYLGEAGTGGVDAMQINNMEFYENRMYNCGREGANFKNITNVYVHDCISELGGQRYYSSQYGDYTTSSATTGVVARCRSYSCASIGFNDSSNGVSFFNNIVYNSGTLAPVGAAQGAAFRLRQGDSINPHVAHIINNVAVNTKGTVVVVQAGTVATSSRCQNNIFVNPANGAYIDSDYVGTVSNNYQTATIANVQFKNSATQNYSLLATSPCVGAGLNLSAYVTDDIIERTRTVPWDQGAYERPTPITISGNTVSIGNASLSRTVPATFTGIRTFSRTVSGVSGAMYKTFSRTLTPNSTALKSTKTRTLSSTTALSGGLARTVDASAALTTQNIQRTIILDRAVLKATISRTVTPNTTALKSVFNRTVTPNTVATKNTLSRSLVLNKVVLSITRTNTVSTVRGVLKSTNTRTLTPNTAATYTILTRTVTPNTSALMSVLSRTVGANTTTVTNQTSLTVTNVAASLLALFPITTLAFVALQSTLERTVGATVAVAETKTRNATATLALQSTLSVYIGSSAAVEVANRREVIATAHLQKTLTYTLAGVNAIIAETHEAPELACTAALKQIRKTNFGKTSTSSVSSRTSITTITGR